MADEIPVIPKVEKLLLQSGNIVNWNRLKRKPNRSPTEELSECMKATLYNIIEPKDKNELQYTTDLSPQRVINEQDQISAEDRGDLKVSVKIFLFKLLSPDAVSEAVEAALKELGISFLETVILALPEFDDDGGEYDVMDIIQPYWEKLEELVKLDKVLSIGIADLDKTMLEQLCTLAKVKPCINQVNLESCCVMPPDLTAYAKENNIQLLTHNDPKNIMPDSKLQELVSDLTTQKDSQNWEMSWAVRYSAIIKCRGIIKTKGYITKSVKDTRKRKC